VGKERRTGRVKRETRKGLRREGKREVHKKRYK
jgi:hypothetical protein